LAELIADRQATEALISHAATLLDRARSLEEQITSPPQGDSPQPSPEKQQQQIED
jgi:hypothetical protein